jgi:hypothetical protein
LDREAQFICYHGDILTKQEIVVYDPLKRLVTHDYVHLPVAGAFWVPVEYELESTETGTRVTERFGYDHGPWFARFLGALMHRVMVRPGRAKLLGAFKAMIEGPDPRGASA